MSDDLEAAHDALAPDDDSWTLSARKEILLTRAIAALMNGASINAAAALVETNPRTLRRWLDTPVGGRLKALAQRELIERGAALSIAGQNAAIAKMIQALEDAQEWRDKIAAAKVLSAFSTQRIEISGANGGAIEVTHQVESLADRLNMMRERTEKVIEARLAESKQLEGADD